MEYGIQNISLFSLVKGTNLLLVEEIYYYTYL